MAFRGVKQNGATIWAALSMLGMLLLCYGNSFDNAWHYDDYSSIVKNEQVHMSHWNWEEVVRALKAGPSHQVIARPLAYLSFAVNYKFGKLDVFGYHLVNFSIHWINALLLFLFIRGTLNLPTLKDKYSCQATLIAWIAAVFWACHPIQVSAVTYIVQRMTSLAGLFYLSAMYSYMVGRRCRRGTLHWSALAICALSCIGALLTKENAVLLFFSILIYDLFLFQSMSKANIRRTLFIGLGIGALLGGLSLLYLDPQNLFAPYTNRPFTMAERLLSQPRVLYIYLSLIAFPMASRMAILHDVDISHTLWDPWTTLPAIAGLLCTITLLGLLSRKNRLFAFCGIFFFLNHTVESSFLNLELIYEHRNYVPTMFIFLPVAIAAVRSLELFYYRASFRVAISLGLTLWLLTAAHTTWSYNRTFRSAISIWEHTLSIYPRLSLPYVNLGKALWHLGERDACYELIRKGMSYDNFKNLQQKGVAYYNLGLYATEEANDLELASFYFQEAIRLYNIAPQIWYELAQVKMKLGDFISADREINDALKRCSSNSDLMRLKALNDLKLGRYQDALKASERLLRTAGENRKTALMVAAESYRLLGDIQKAINSWYLILEDDPDNMAALMALIEFSVHQGRADDLEGYVKRLLAIKGVSELNGEVEVKLGNENIMPYVPNIEVIKEALHRYGGLDQSAAN